MPSGLILSLLLSAAAQDPSSDLLAYRKGAPSDKSYLRPVLLIQDRDDDWATDYPLAAAAAGEGGRVELSVLVDTQDRIVSCAILKSDASRRINDAACAILRRRGKMLHALSMSGKPIMATSLIEMQFFPKRLVRVPPAPPMSGIVSPSLLHNRTNLEFAVEPDWLSVLTPGRAAQGETAVLFNSWESASGEERRYCSVQRGDEEVGKAVCELLKKNGAFRVTKPPEPREYGNSLQLLLQWDGHRMRYMRPTIAEGRDLQFKGSRIPWKSDAPVSDNGFASLLFGSDGVVKSCQIIASTGQDAADVAACHHWLNAVAFTPPLDIFGKSFDVSLKVRLQFER